MPGSPVASNELERLAELDRYAILATPPEEMFDVVTKLAARVFGCPIALVTFVAAERQWFKSCVGLTYQESSREISFCSWTILSDGVMVVRDTTGDARFAGDRMASEEGSIRFYAGAPLVSPRGFRLGTLCILDVAPRPDGLCANEIATLGDLARMVMGHLEARVAALATDELKNMLQTTLLSVGDGVIAIDLESRITFMNPVAEELTGWREDEARRRRINEVFSIVSEGNHAVVENPAVRAMAEGAVVGLANRTVLVHKDGRHIPIDDSGAPICRNGRIAGSVLIFRDVSERRTVERTLEHSEHQFRQTFANAPLGLVLTQLDGRFIESNEAYRRMTGYAEKELAEIDFLSLTHPSEVKFNRTLFQRLIGGEISSYVLDKRILNKEGEVRWVRAHAALLRDAHQRATKVIGLVEDVTEGKLAERRYQFLAESIPQMVWTATADGLLDYVNDQGAQYFQTSQESLLGGGWLDFVHSEDQAGAAARWQESLEKVSAYETQFRLRRGEDHTWRLHLVRASPLIGEGGKAAHWFGTCTDIEDQQESLRQIEYDRRRWRDLLYQAPAGIAVLSGSQHEFEWVNPAFEALVGRPPALLVGCPILKALPEIASQMWGSRLSEVFHRGQMVQGTEALARLGPEGEERDVYINFVCMPTRSTAGTVDGVFMHVTDVTEMVLARKAIEESESQFRVLAETIPHLAWMANGNGDIFWYNQRWYAYTGSSMEDMAGWGWQSVHDPETLPEVIKNWRSALESGSAFEMVFPLRGANGEFKPFLTRVEPIKDTQGSIARWFGTNTDIADQLKKEEQLRRINRDLEEFSFVAGHDLQEPLRMVNIYTELLLRKKAKTAEDHEMYARFISDGVQRMQTLIDDLLTFSRSVHVEATMAGRADLSVALDEALAVLKGSIEESGAIISSKDLPTAVVGETSQMAHVFQNLLSNALKYRKKTAAPEIRIGAEKTGNRWVVSVQDNGIGFQPEYAERIFGLFKRLHDREYAGTGLGLAICKRIVERYGGRMWAESEPGAGSTFYFTLLTEG